MRDRLAGSTPSRTKSRLLASFQERRRLAVAAWQRQDGQPDTEQLRLALRQYRSLISIVLPRGS